MTHSLLRIAIVAALAAVVSASPASADAIDGDWCRTGGQRMNIVGAAIVTPGGQKTTGDYTRHSFSYVVPAGEAGAGTSISIQLLGEDLAQARQGTDPAIQEWRRCRAGVS